MTSNSTVNGIAANATTVYLAGIFTSINNVAKAGAAAVSATNGAVKPFAVTPAGGNIRQIIVSPDASKVVLGGAFTTMNGSSDPGYGLAMVDATTGAMLPLPLNALLRNGGTNVLDHDAGRHPDRLLRHRLQPVPAPGQRRGRFPGGLVGHLVWVEDCHGDTYSLALSGDEVYVAGHPHYCGGVGGFPQTQPGPTTARWPSARPRPASSAPTRTATSTTAGKPAPSR